MKLEVRVQHHPSRAELLLPLLAQLPSSTKVISADISLPPNPWRDYRRCLLSASESATHLLILQDDAVLCRYFIETARKAIEARTDSAICFCVCGEPSEDVQRLFSASQSGSQWARLCNYRFVPVIALAWPIAVIKPALAFVEAQNWPAAFRSDDEIVGRAFRELDVPVLATVPSLVDHDDSLPSTIRTWNNGPAPERQAACFISDDCDPLSIDWR